MALTAGTRLGPYETTALIGAGGMGEVYRATDTRLDRTVAIKVLPEHLADRADLRDRFEREARAVSSLNHPHICTLHDVGEQDGIHYLVMEYVEGDTLQQRLEKGRMPLDQALEYAIQIADALDKAHRQGVVHRDLKPGNIMVTKSGTKLLDFGLAKLKGDASEISPLSQMPTQDASAPLTAEGTIIGTLQFMAPEQLEGKEADARTDIFAFGAVVYEMVTGKKAFEGASQASLISAIMGSDPRPITEVQPVSPPMLDHVITACLAKNPDDRCQSAADLMRELKWVARGNEQIETVPIEMPSKNRERITWTVATIAVVAALTLGALAYFQRAPADNLLVSFPIYPPDGWTFAPGGLAAEGGIHPINVSPDGRRVAFVALNAGGQKALWVRPLDSTEAVMLRGTEDAWSPFWSPDSRFLAFFAAGKLKKIDVSEGLATTICDVDADGFTGSGLWISDNSILFRVSGQDPTPTQVVSADGGRPTSATTSMSTGASVLPDGQHFLEAIREDDPNGTSDRDVVVGSFEAPERKPVIEQVDALPILYSQGQILSLRDSALMAHPFDMQRLEVTGNAVVVAEDVSVGNLRPGRGLVSVSENGVLVYRTNPAPVDSRLLWFDRNGNEIGILAEDAAYEEIELAPDGNRAAVTIIDRATQMEDVWLFDVSRVGPRAVHRPGLRMPAVSRSLGTRPGSHACRSRQQAGQRMNKS